MESLGLLIKALFPGLGKQSRLNTGGWQAPGSQHADTIFTDRAAFAHSFPRLWIAANVYLLKYTHFGQGISIGIPKSNIYREFEPHRFLACTNSTDHCRLKQPGRVQGRLWKKGRRKTTRLPWMRGLISSSLDYTQTSCLCHMWQPCWRQSLTGLPGKRLDEAWKF